MTVAGTGAALASANVAIPSLNLGGTTAPTGSYSVGDIPAGTHEVVISLIGYREERRQVSISNGEITRLDVSLTEAALLFEGLVVVGTRAQPRTVTESPVPVDVIPTREIVNQGATDLADLVRKREPVVQCEHPADQ